MSWRRSTVRPGLTTRHAAPPQGKISLAVLEHCRPSGRSCAPRCHHGERASAESGLEACARKPHAWIAGRGLVFAPPGCLPGAVAASGRGIRLKLIPGDVRISGFPEGRFSPCHPPATESGPAQRRIARLMWTRSSADSAVLDFAAQPGVRKLLFPAPARSTPAAAPIWPDSRGLCEAHPIRSPKSAMGGQADGRTAACSTRASTALRGEDGPRLSLRPGRTCPLDAPFCRRPTSSVSGGGGPIRVRATARPGSYCMRRSAVALDHSPQGPFLSPTMWFRRRPLHRRPGRHRWPRWWNPA